MGSDPNEKRNGRRSRTKSPEPVLFIVFRPSEAQKRDILEANLSMQGCWDILYTLLEEGHRISLGYKPENGAVFIHLREGGADFDKAITVSCWHGELLRVHQMLAYAVVHVYPEFPLIQTGFSQLAPDW